MLTRAAYVPALAVTKTVDIARDYSAGRDKAEGRHGETVDPLDQTVDRIEQIGGLGNDGGGLFTLANFFNPSAKELSKRSVARATLIRGNRRLTIQRESLAQVFCHRLIGAAS